MAGVIRFFLGSVATIPDDLCGFSLFASKDNGNPGEFLAKTIRTGYQRWRSLQVAGFRSNPTNPKQDGCVMGRITLFTDVGSPDTPGTWGSIVDCMAAQVPPPPVTCSIIRRKVNRPFQPLQYGISPTNLVWLLEAADHGVTGISTLMLSIDKKIAKVASSPKNKHKEKENMGMEPEGMFQLPPLDSPNVPCASPAGTQRVPDMPPNPRPVSPT